MKLLNLTNWLHSLVGFFTFQMGGGGGGSQPQTQTSYSTNLPEYAKPFYEELLKQTGKQVYKTDPSGNVTGVQEYTPYTGQRVAPFNPEQLKVQSRSSRYGYTRRFWRSSYRFRYRYRIRIWYGGCRVKSSVWLYPMAISGGTFDAPAASYYMSPYQSNVTDIAVREARKQADLAKTAGMTGAIGRGTFGGARQALLQSEQERGAQQNIANIRAQGQQSSYENAQKMFEADQARRMKAAELGQQGQQFAAGLGKELGVAGLQTGMEGAAKQGALAATEQASRS
jgi:hypothetical protein